MHGTGATHSCGCAGGFLETGPGGPGCSSPTPCPRSSLTPSAACWGEGHASPNKPGTCTGLMLSSAAPSEVNPLTPDQCPENNSVLLDRRCSGSSQEGGQNRTAACKQGPNLEDGAFFTQSHLKKKRIYR